MKSSVDIPRKNMLRNMQAAILAVFWCEIIFISSSNTFVYFVGFVIQQCHSSGLQVLKRVKSVCYSVLADRAMVASVYSHVESALSIVDI
jgi:hypothetical protein